MLKPGDVAPEIDAVTSIGTRFVLSAQTHKLCTVVFFFPKAFTPGCALETRRFRENYAEISLLGASIVGVSTDDHDTQCMFAESLKTPFPMIGDKTKRISRAYGVLWPILERAMRVTFIVDASQKIVSTIHHEINIVQHRDEVLRVIDRLRVRAQGSASSHAATLVIPTPAPLMNEGDEPFEFVRPIGAGGMGTVYLARDRRSDRVVAVKLLAPDADPARFDREIVVLSGLVHPNIARYIAHGTSDDGQKYLVMEWIDGRSIHQLLDDGPLGAREGARVARDVALGLAAAHAAGIVHRDIKPSNVLVAREGAVKILDFGIALSRERVADALTRTGHVVGTPGYMAPEQARADREIDARTDLFALGCLLFRAVEGRKPFRGDDAHALLHDVLNSDPPQMKNAPPPLAALVTELLAKDPENRPRSAADVAARLTAILASM